MTEENDAAVEAAIAKLGLELARAIGLDDHEQAARLQAEINRLAGIDPGKPHQGIIGRGSPGAMGLGTDQATLRPPAGWRPPPRPDLMTRTSKPLRGPGERR